MNEKGKPGYGSGKIAAFFILIYDAFAFVMRFFKEVLLPPFHFREFIRQCYEIGYKSLALISVTGFVTGLVFTKQSRPSLAEFGATSWLPSLVSIAIIKALAPLVTALICAGKVGSNIGAELGSMKVTEQIEAMEVSATNPFKYLVVSRIIATTLMIPILSFYFGGLGLLGSFFDIHMNESTSFFFFFKSAFDKISFADLYTSIVKAIAFGFTIGTVGCMQGYRATQGTVGVGRAANSAVVISMFLIFIEEIIIVTISNTLRTL